MLIDFQLEHDAHGRLVLVLPDGSRHVGVDPVRAFPLSEPRAHISILSADGQELVWIPRLDDYSSKIRQVLEAELAQRHFLPLIQRVVRITGQVEPVICEVETDRGEVTFQIKGEEDVKRLTGGRVLVTDSNGVRYLIPNVAALDPTSRRLLERYV